MGHAGLAALTVPSLPGRPHHFSLWAPPIAYMAAIFYASSLSRVPGTEGVSDTVLHLAGYGGLALVWLRALARGRWTGVTMAALAAGWAITTTYGATDEWHQMYTPGRHAEVRDLVNDAIGAALALGLAGACGRMTSTRPRF